MNPMEQVQKIHEAAAPVAKTAVEMEPVGFDVIWTGLLMMVVYSVFLGAVTSVVKKVVDTTDPKTKRRTRPAWFARVLPMVPLALGGLSGPLAVPAIMFWSGLKLPVHVDAPKWAIFAFVGVGAGAIASSSWKAWRDGNYTAKILRFVFRKTEQEVQQLRESSEVDVIGDEHGLNQPTDEIH